LKKTDRVLDIGCGDGQKARPLARYLSAEGSYEGIDILPSAIEWCKEHYAVFPNFHFQVADVTSSHYNRNGRESDRDYRLPFSDCDFDMVFLCSVFTHMLLAGVENYLSEIGRVLKPGGRCVATFFLLNSTSLRRLAMGRSRFPFGPSSTPECWVLTNENPSKGVALDEIWVRNRMDDAGLRVAEVTYGTWNGSPDLLAATQDTVFAVKEVRGL
jgi:SAM-dependent methyltransferase